MSQPSLLRETNSDSNPPKPWLLKHYEAKRQRTVTLVKASVNQLVKERQTVTIEAICRKSAEIDAEGRGVKKSAILENPEAHAYYRQHSTSYRRAQVRKRKGRAPVSAAQPLRIDPHRDVDRARYRYLQMTKPELVKRLLTVEQAYAELAEQQARLQFELLEIQQHTTEHQRQPRSRQH
jgi:hypothetical protein